MFDDKHSPELTKLGPLYLSGGGLETSEEGGGGLMGNSVISNSEGIWKEELESVSKSKFPSGGPVSAVEVEGRAGREGGKVKGEVV